MNNWTLHNSKVYHSYWLECIDNMLSNRVESLRYYEKIGYYSLLKEELSDSKEKVSHEYSHLPHRFQSHNLIIENMYDKLSVDLLFESKEIECDVKRKAFGVNKKMIEDEILKKENIEEDSENTHSLSSFSPKNQKKTLGFSSRANEYKNGNSSNNVKSFMEKRRKSRINEQINTEIFSLNTPITKPKYLFKNLKRNKEFYPLVTEFLAKNEKLLKLKQGGKIDKDGNILKTDLIEYQKEFSEFSEGVFHFPNEEGESSSESSDEEEKINIPFVIKLYESQYFKEILDSKKEEEDNISSQEDISVEKPEHKRNNSEGGGFLITVSPVAQRKDLSTHL